MNILITGANGQLGNEIKLLADTYPNHTYFFTDVQELNICDEQAVNEFVLTNVIQLIINCAAYTAVDSAEDHKDACDQINHIAPGYLAKAAQQNGAAMIQISTDYVFNGKSYLPYVETDLTCPESVYGYTKQAGEDAVLKACTQSVIIRTSWLYSTFGNNFVKTMLRLGRERDKLGVIFDQVGTPTYARDLAIAIFAILNKEFVPGIYHFSNEGVCSWYDFTVAIHRIAGIEGCELLPLHSVDYPTKATRPHFSVLDKTKIKETYSVEIPHWEKSLAQCISLLNQ